MTARCACRSAAVLVSLALLPFTIAFTAPQGSSLARQVEIVQRFPVTFPMSEVEEISFSGTVGDVVLSPNLADVLYVVRAERFTQTSSMPYSVSERRNVLYKNILPTLKSFYGMRRPAVSPDGGRVACAISYVVDNQAYGGLLLDDRVASASRRRMVIPSGIPQPRSWLTRWGRLRTNVRAPMWASTARSRVPRSTSFSTA
ncbi:MAG: hypothetical protein LAQ69_47995 [Acidobacteriia bacterium]|nr:hypothetical protein [Terriglobia bacterium]